jgi:hypothetical protein
MIVEIVELFSVNGIPHVNFSTPIGDGIAAWVGRSPKVGQQCDVELDLDDVFYWGENIKPSIQGIGRIYSENNKIHLTAELASLDDDNCAVIRFNGSTALIELNGMPDHKPTFVDLEITKIFLYPTNT